MGNSVWITAGTVLSSAIREEQEGKEDKRFHKDFECAKTVKIWQGLLGAGI